MGSWDDASTWVGQGLRREVFGFGPSGSELYGSLYAAQAPSRRDGVLVCSSWGFEADQTERLAHHIALTMARDGGAGMVFHYPGFGDSRGASLAAATVDSLAAAAVAAIEEAARRMPGLSWFPAGLMIGAAVACLAQRMSDAAGDRLLFVQPALSPSAYFGALAKSSQRVSLSGGRVCEMSYGYPLPRAIVDAGVDADLPVREALRAFDGDGAVVRCARPDRDVGPADFAEIEVDGVWRFGGKGTQPLERGVAEWIGS